MVRTCVQRWSHLFFVTFGLTCMPMPACLAANAVEEVPSVADEACIKWAGACSQALVTNMFSVSHRTDSRLVCRDVSDFLGCLRGPDCSMLADSFRLKLSNTLRQSLDQLDIDCPDITEINPTDASRPRGGPVVLQSSTKDQKRMKTDNDCVDSVKFCSKQYMTTILKYSPKTDTRVFNTTLDRIKHSWICPYMQDYINCLTGSSCGNVVRQKATERIKKTMEQIFNNFVINCDFDVETRTPNEMTETPGPATTSPKGLVQNKFDHEVDQQAYHKAATPDSRVSESSSSNSKPGSSTESGDKDEAESESDPSHRGQQGEQAGNGSQSLISLMKYDIFSLLCLTSVMGILIVEA